MPGHLTHGAPPPSTEGVPFERSFRMPKWAASRPDRARRRDVLPASNSSGPFVGEAALAVRPKRRQFWKTGIAGAGQPSGFLVHSMAFPAKDRPFRATKGPRYRVPGPTTGFGCATLSVYNVTATGRPTGKRPGRRYEGAVIAPRASEEVTLQCNVHPSLKEGSDAVAQGVCAQ